VTDHTTRKRADGVTLRSVLIALALLLIIAPGVLYYEVGWRAGSIVTDGPAVWQLTLLGLLAGAMGLPIFRRRGLSRKELLAVYCILLVAAPLYSYTVLFYVLPKAPIYYHMARANPIWETTFLQRIPLWFAPTDTQAIDGFFEGKARVPWGLWAVPLAAWWTFMAAAFTASVCLIAIMQRQWIRGERLTFPLAQIPLQLVELDDRGSGRLTFNRVFWIGAGISFLLNFLSGLSQRVPAMPAFPLGPVVIMPWLKVGPLAGLGAFYFTFWPWLIAIAYIIPKEISFSCWFFWLVRMSLHVIGIAAGTTPELPEEVWGSDFPAPYYQATGAVMALGIWAFWIARPHLARALRVVFTSRARGADADEPLPYRWAIIGLVVSLGWLVGWCLVAECRFAFALALVLMIVGLMVVWARIRAETALVASILDGYQIVLAPFGSSALRPREFVTLMTMRWATFPSPNNTFNICVINSLETYKIADAAHINPRRLTAAMAVGFVIALGVGSYLLLAGIYHYGYFGTRAGAAPDWPAMQSRWDGSFIANSMLNPSTTDYRGLAGIGAGVVVCMLLGVARLRFWWWPLHPVGYIVGNSWGMHWYLMPFLFGWAAKSLVIRYGGLRLYRGSLPFAIGLIAGDVMNSALWSLVALATQGRVAGTVLQ
jgi:hypothetical protein